MLHFRVIARFAYLECHCSLFRTVRTFVAQLVHGVLLLYLVVSSALERWLFVAARVRKELQSCTQLAAINFMDFELLVSFLATSNDSGRSFFPLFAKVNINIAM